MKNILAAAALFASLAAASPSATAQVTDGVMCYTAIMTQTGTAGFGTTSYPQVNNATQFYCTNSTPYTIRQLSQLGFTIVQSTPVLLSTTTSPEGTVTVKTRQQLIIQK